MDKEEYFRRLYTLNSNSDEEEDTNETREIIRQGPIPILSSSPSSLEAVQERRSQQSRIQKKVPTFYPTTSALVSSVSVVKETPILTRKSSLLRYDVSTPESNDYSFQKSTPPEGQLAKAKPEQVRSASTPNIGTVVMTNSNGVTSMLRKSETTSMLRKRKRKDFSISFVPESDRVFAGQTFFYIPPDDIAPVRRLRITKARKFGATWSKEWIPSITHVVVDKALTYMDVMKFLKPTLKADALPSNVILVNEDYPIDCTQYVSLLDPSQRQYLVDGYGMGVEEQAATGTSSKKSDKSLELKSTKPRTWDNPPEKQAPPRSQSPSQQSIPNAGTESSSGVWILPTETKEIGFVQSPQQTTPSPNALNSSSDSIELADVWRKTSFSGFSDVLDGMIQEAKEYEHLPLDDAEDEDGDRPPSSEGDGLDDSGDSDRKRSPIRAPKAKRKYKRKGALNQENFSCMTGGTEYIAESNPNGIVISILQEMVEYYTRIKDVWRPLAYRKAIGTLKKQTTKITTYDEAIQLQWIGHRLAEKIQEISLTNRLRRLDNAKLEPNDIILQTFLKIYDAGFLYASAWIQAGCKTLDDLKAHGKLTRNQRIGLEHYDDFNTRIPREQVTALGEIVKKAAASIDPEVEAIIGGSYRRGASASGDIDFILTKPCTTSSHQLMPFLGVLVDRLTKDGFLVAVLAEPRTGDGSKWHGACVLPGNPTWRRIDFLIVAEVEFGAALIYFTGDDIFNRSMRLLSSKKGMRLNQRGLYKDVMRGPGRVKLNEGTLIEGADERKIFEILKVPWRPPEQRICH